MSYCGCEVEHGISRQGVPVLHARTAPVPPLIVTITLASFVTIATAVLDW